MLQIKWTDRVMRKFSKGERGKITFKIKKINKRH